MLEASPGGVAVSEVQHRVDEKLPFLRLLVLGMQHVLVMYSGDIAVPLVIATALRLPPSQTVTLINSSLFVAGIATVIQSLGVGKFGARLPVMMGATFLSVAPMVSMGLDPAVGVRGFHGALLVSGLLGILIAPYMSRVMAIFPPLVSGSLILLLGVSLLSVAVNWVGGGRPAFDQVINGRTVSVPNAAYGEVSSLLLALFVLTVILLLSRFGKGIWRTIAILIGIVSGTLLAIPLHAVRLQEVAGAPWIAMIQPFIFGAPTFQPGPIVTMCLVMVIVLVESAAVFLALGKITGKTLSASEMAAALRADGIGIVAGGLFNAFPYTSFSQNVGLVQVTRIHSRYVCAMGGAILLLLGSLPRLGDLVAAIPQPVLGGAGW